ncbi:MAG: sigma-70 family RNA polymerase sigma factor [Verrucomicrobia bacterium]|nr:sigma-70 family RNA polymerase sigma factor [Verrucomicrobiota bacterium]
MRGNDIPFATTRWNVVLAAAQPTAPNAAAALNELCQAYWKPLYAYLRRCGYSTHDAEDLTQAFLADLLSRDGLKGVGPHKGKFRSFLLVSLKNFLANEWARSHAQKRGGGQPLIALDAPAAEQGVQREPVDGLNPERIFDRRWAYTILEQVRARLRTEAAAAGKGERFNLLAGFLPGEPSELSQAAAAQRLAISEGAFKVEVHRLRQRFRELLRAEVAHTVSSPAEIDDELRYLIAVVSE